MLWMYGSSHSSANLFLNLFSLMLDSGVPDIALEPDKTVQKVSMSGSHSNVLVGVAVMVLFFPVLF